MNDRFRLFPEAASEHAREVDGLYFALVGMSLFMTLLIFFLVLYFSARFRRHAGNPPGRRIAEKGWWEVVWVTIPILVFLTIFGFGAAVYMRMKRIPEKGLDVYAYPKQWMWKFDHADGRREANELHVPAGRDVRLTMVSEDVIHSFFVPAFRVKQDILPGRYTKTWFRATKPGVYRLFCAEYCGPEHSDMVGRVVVMEPSRFQRWAAGAEPGAESLVQSGERLLQSLGCANCHGPQDSVRAPSLVGKFGTEVELEDGRTVVIDEPYVRESIVHPDSMIVKGYEPIMPPYEGRITEEELLKIVAYIKAVGAER